MRLPLRTAALTTLLLLLSAAAAPTTAPTTQPAALDWSEAAKHVGESVTVTGPVKGTHVAGKNVVLNVGKDFPEKDRFCVMMPFDAAAGNANEQFVGKTVTVTGKVKLYKEVAEIVTKTAADVKLTGTASPTTAPAAPAGPVDR